jgi:hypothetical protein
MSYGGYTRAESMYCNRCKQYIRWDETDLGDMNFRGVIDKLRHHQKNDKECVRIQKLAEVLDEETDLLGCQKYL